jgi:hypothetical protein
MCFQDSSTATRILVGSPCAAVAILVGWCVWTIWERRREEQPITFADEEEKTVTNEFLSSERTENRPPLLDRLMSLSGQGRKEDVEMTRV